MNLIKTTSEIFSQLIHLNKSLAHADYIRPAELLFNNSIGKHYRHIIEFYEMFLAGYESGNVNYDERSHDKKAEQDKEFAAERLQFLLKEISKMDESRKLKLNANYSNDSLFQNTVETSAGRELVYNIEHAIHHIAMIKIAVINLLPHIKLPDNFGVAYSTIFYREKECAQ